MDATDTLLLIDTCGEIGSVALLKGERLMAEAALPERMASAGLLGAVRQLLADRGMALPALTAIGVVNGPGSFTGVRVGLAVAKGLSEAAGIRLAAVSRLAVLAEAGKVKQGFAALRAGRDQVYVRVVEASERSSEHLMNIGTFAELAKGQPVVYAEASVGAMLPPRLEARFVELTANDAASCVR